MEGEALIQGYKISSKTSDMDISVIHGFISGSYWAKNIPLHTMKTAIGNSLCFGVFTHSGNQVAFARMITDKATFAYLADVFVLEEHRGKGIGKWLIRHITEHPSLKGIRRIVLATNDAHSLYEQFGFTTLNKPESFMEILQADVYKKA